MTHRLLAIALFGTFLCGYMEWGPGNRAFIFHAVFQILRSGTLLESLVHPLVLTGLLGLVLSLYAATRATSHRLVNRVAILLLSPMVFMVILAGSLGGNLKMIASGLPFVAVAVALWRR